MRTLRNIYLVARWGNEAEGPNGKDTLYLVVARSHLFASKLVDKELLKLPHQCVSPKVNWVCLLGKVDESSQLNGVLKGPFYDMSALSGARVAWAREHRSKRWRVV